MFKRHHLKQNYSDTMQPIDSLQYERRSTHKPSTPLFEASLKMCVHSNGVEPTLWASQLECWWIPESKCVSKCDSECSNNSRTSAWYITRCRRWASVFCFPFFYLSKILKHLKQFSSGLRCYRCCKCIRFFRTKLFPQAPLCELAPGDRLLAWYLLSRWYRLASLRFVCVTSVRPCCIPTGTR